MWFNGLITEAITKSKAGKRIMVVFVHHDAVENEHSQKMREYWEDSEITTRCENANIIALELAENSEGARQFAQIYPVSIVPVSFIIGRRGVPLEILTMTADMTRDAFSNKVRIAIETYEKQLAEDEMAVLSESAVPVTPSTEPHNLQSSELLVTERNELVKQKLADKWEKDEAARKDIEKEKELSGRSEGEMMQQKREEEIDRHIRDRARQRRETDSALQMVRRQIAADRAERQELKTKQQAPVENETHAMSKPLTPKSEHTPSNISEVKIQCRFMDGSNLVVTFDVNGTLREVANAVERDGRQRGNFRLVQMFPRRQFTEKDMACSFGQLDLIPSCVILVIAESGNLAAPESLWQRLTAPLRALYHLLLVFFGFAHLDGHTPALPRAPSTTQNPDGRMRRFHSNEDADDDQQATWNGNSTQQL